ncbi:MAG: phycobiliprotein lyase [Synechococcaceae cyanobacterium SM2_3_2]|nr:phycobiliprotein lyase [Synechococcaceae cyanobacterium SM2_3_2]
MTTVMDFFRQSEGQWMTQRTSHHLAFRQSENGRSTLLISVLEIDDPKVVSTCQMHEVDPSLAAGGARVRWNGEQDWDNDEYKGDVILVPLPDPGDPSRGRLLRDQGYAEKVPVIGHYRMEPDGAMILTTAYEMTESEERLWFASPNLRLRTSVVKRFGGFSMASFCSEIRKLSPTEPTVQATDIKAPAQPTA